MKTLRYFSFNIAMLLLAFAASSCNDRDVINNIENNVSHTVTMTFCGYVQGFDDSRADADVWNNGDVLHLNLNTNNGIVSGTATYDKSTNAWSLKCGGKLVEESITHCEVYYFAMADSKVDLNTVYFNYHTIVYADKNAFYVYKESAISITARLVPQTARFRFKGTPGTTFNVSGYDCYSGFDSQSLQQSTGKIKTIIADDGYSPYIYGFVSDESRMLVVANGDYEYRRTIQSSNFKVGKSGRFTLPDEVNYNGWMKGYGKFKVFSVNGVSFKMIKVEAGTFNMGNNNEFDSYPEHQVTLTKDYYIGETEVTQSLWYAVMGQKPTSDGEQWSSTYGLGDNYPAYNISWNDCQTFITKLNQLTGLTFRLPTEAEWEYAARGGKKATTQTLYSGSNTVDNVAWYYDNSSFSTHEVANKAANDLGLYDMSGNVGEWCNDWDGSYSDDAQTDPTGPIDGKSRILRGGAFGSLKYSCQVDSRAGAKQNSTGISHGIRLVIDGLNSDYNGDNIVEVNGVTIKMKLVEAGTFTMGATEEQTAYNNDEKPAHQVTLTKDYYMGETEVTQELWYAVIGEKPTSKYKWSSSWGLGDNYPAYYISWNDCQEFITKLNQLTGLIFRLPTEAEWEYAARGGKKATTQTLYSGSNTIDDVAWYDVNSSSSTHVVAGKAANALGLYDMSGNVWEWCNDWYDNSYYSSSPQTDPIGPNSGSYRVLRGGSWGSNSFNSRVSSRNDKIETYRNYTIGMRLAITAE